MTGRIITVCSDQWVACMSPHDPPEVGQPYIRVNVGQDTVIGAFGTISSSTEAARLFATPEGLAWWNQNIRNGHWRRKDIDPPVLPTR